MSILFLLFTMTTTTAAVPSPSSTQATTVAVQHIASTMNDNQGDTNLCLNSNVTSRGELGADWARELGVQCCVDNVNGVVTASRPDCLKSQTWQQAYDKCEFKNARLCTPSEVSVDKLGSGKGCSFDAYHVWTAENCSPVEHVDNPCLYTPDTDGHVNIPNSVQTIAPSPGIVFNIVPVPGCPTSLAKCNASGLQQIKILYEAHPDNECTTRMLTLF